MYRDGSETSACIMRAWPWHGRNKYDCNEGDCPGSSRCKHDNLRASRCQKCLEEEVLPSFVRVFSQNTRDKPLAELLELGKKKAPTECEWLMDHVEDIRAAVERALDNANVL